jgi:DNA-binding winged helix-turn-helix (wHTH) protein
VKEFPPFRLDTVNQCLWRGEERVALTPKAFSILNFLVERAGRLVTQREILDALWRTASAQTTCPKAWRGAQRRSSRSSHDFG